MQSKAATVAQYLAELPPDRREAIEKVRAVVLKNLGKGYEEGMQYGMIGYYVPHSIFPAGYHCDPKQPLPFAGLASQKNHMALYMCTMYMDPATAAWFQQAWAAEAAKGNAKRLDMGKGCVRFRNVDDIPLNVIGEAVKRAPVKRVIDVYESNLAMSRAARGETKKTSTKKPTTKKAPSKPANKKTAKKAVAKKAVMKAVKKAGKKTRTRA